MIGKQDVNICPICGGRLESGIATIPFILDDTIVVIKDVPAEICADCQEPYLAGHATNRVMALLNHLKVVHSELSVVSYSETEHLLSEFEPV
jgi:YgiT-type zinc finger domain-containing protein